MPAKSVRQAKAARMALAAKRGHISVSKLKGAAKLMYKSMSEQELQEFSVYKKKHKKVKK